jgi:hypothetical protein
MMSPSQAIFSSAIAKTARKKDVADSAGFIITGFENKASRGYDEPILLHTILISYDAKLRRNLEE